ncbi:DUF732 domain-containing protein [Mycobacterium sp.]|uniref:DUF732 domain-containing protein n=1 Tax=Mycobacterium sp. TaxID=1785 RepID=UPI0025EF499F|nr:DUF732 domain-containing protein [Mycobacterium sp.]
MGKKAILVITGPLLLLSATVAHADANDDEFVQMSKNIGVDGAPADLIRIAKSVCAGLDGGSGPDEIADALVSQLGLKSGRAAKFVAFSATHYCPKYSNLEFNRPH